MEKAYAQALWKAIEKGLEPKKAIAALHASLQAHGRESLMPRIAAAFERLAQRNARRGRITLTVAKEDESRAAIKSAKSVLDTFGEGTEIDVCVDPSLIGGWRVEGKETLVDASYKKYLLDMFNRATA